MPDDVSGADDLGVVQGQLTAEHLHRVLLLPQRHLSQLLLH